MGFFAELQCEWIEWDDFKVALMYPYLQLTYFPMFGNVLDAIHIFLIFVSKIVGRFWNHLYILFWTSITIVYMLFFC